ncbi:MAG: hypothetical protein IJR94_05085 [Synergistaceae bacterium]|nr:hypothetical protein [Synergistaceae bacterium]
MRKIFLSCLLIFALIFSCGAAKKSDDRKRMGIFISNFTEIGLMNFDLENKISDDGVLHLGDPDNMHELIRFGIAHNIINNKKLIGKCKRKGCEFGPDTLSKEAVASSVKKYFDLPVKHKSIKDPNDYPPFTDFDGKLYHFDKSEWGTDTVYYADVQRVEQNEKILTMSGELYDFNNPSDRPATFTAQAKPYTWNKKDTWAILSLNVEWK